MRPPHRPLIALGFGLWILLAGAFALGRAPAPPTVLGPAPSLALEDEGGRRLAGGDLRGRVLIVGFLFTRCTGVCPMLAARMVELQESLPPQDGSAPVDLVAVTVDPEHDQPEVLAEYARRWGMDPTRWHLLTGSRAEVDGVVAGFQQAVERGPTSEGGIPDIRHSQRLALVDPAGDVRGLFETDAEGLAALRRAARQVARGPISRAGAREHTPGG